MGMPRHLVLLGHPVAHSLSPLFQNALLERAGIPVRYEARDVSDAELPATLEAMRAADVAEKTGRTRLAKLARDLPGYHTSPAEAAEVARDAGAKKLVFSHLVPSPPNFIAQIGRAHV